jgi:hypothetical protein
MRRALVALAVACAVAFAAGGVVQAQKAPDSVILKGSPMGGVKFNHAEHVKVAGQCTTCHHPSKPEKPSKTPTEKCTSCHTKTPAAPMKTPIVAAFHGGPTAKQGVCIDCHMQQNKAGKKAPTTCTGCHKKENG